MEVTLMRIRNVALLFASLFLLVACGNSQNGGGTTVKNGAYYEIQYDYDYNNQKNIKYVVDYEIDKIGASGVKVNSNYNWRYCYGFIVKGNRITSYALSWNDDTKETSLEENAWYEFDKFGSNIVISLQSVDSVDDYLLESVETILYKDGCFALKRSGSHAATYYVTLDYAKNNGIKINKAA